MKKTLINVFLIITVIIIYYLQSNLFMWFNIAGVKPNLFVVLALFIGLFANRTMGIAYGVGIVDEKVIDNINILEATHIAMKEAYEKADNMCKEKTGKNINLLFVDALIIKNVDIKQVDIVHGDALSLSIAAASIIAKVTRDRMMIEYDKEFPEYGFAKHKGYGTKFHMDKLKAIGPCDIHRKSFLSFLNNDNKIYV